MKSRYRKYGNKNYYISKVTREAHKCAGCGYIIPVKSQNILSINTKDKGRQYLCNGCKGLLEELKDTEDLMYDCFDSF